jgi:hypothetical protein
MKKADIEKLMSKCRDPETVAEFERLIADSLKKQKKAQANKRPLGVILYENEEIVAIATKLFDASTNSKTGGMVQTYILVKSVKPTEAIKLGLDISICGMCPARGDGTGKERYCYVNLGQGPRSVYDAWQRGRYVPLDSDNVRWFDGKRIRLGSYGDPAFVPVSIWERILKNASGWTGYTHQWRTAGLQAFCMASADNEREATEAQAMGYRTFRVGRGKALANEIVCPASEEAGKKTTCERCGLCQGASKKAKNILIAPHGSGKNHNKS